MKFVELAETFERLEQVSSSLSMKSLLASFLSEVPRSEIGVVCYLCLGRIASDYDDLNIGMAEKTVLKAVNNAFDKNPEVLFRKKGDVGLVAELFVVNEKASLSVLDVFEGLRKVASISGAGSQDKKIAVLSGLLRKCTSIEARYLCRIVLGKLRLGVAEMLLLDSLAAAFSISKRDLEDAYNTCPDIGVVARTAAIKGIKGLHSLGVLVGRPVQMMLCQRAKSFRDILAHSPVVAVEEKYDGERVQVHKSGNNVVLYSRRLENITAQFPDVVDAVKSSVRLKQCIVEGEIVPVGKKGRVLSFQVLMQRKRKHGVADYVKKVPVKVFLFDCLFDGKSLIKQSYGCRRKILEKVVKKGSLLDFSTRIECSSVSCVDKFFRKSLKKGYEGIVAKSLGKESIYQPGKRGWLWIKWKPEYAEGLQDTFDLVVVGAFYGRGRRAGNYGALLCAAYNERARVFESFCKVGSGFSDEVLADLPKLLGRYIVKHRSVAVKSLLVPDVWFVPGTVIEVLGAGITRSPVHCVAEKHGKGLALRFPRFVRFRDKKPEQATTSDEISRMVK